MSVTRVLLIAIVSFTAACDQAPTRPTIPEQPPITTVPTSPFPPTTPASISGNWAGTFDVSDRDSDCSFFNPAPALGSFTQDNDRLHGTLKLSTVHACWPTLGEVTFDGVNDAANLRGTLTREEFSGEATGMLSGDVLELQITDMWNPTRTAAIVPAGVMRLHRP